MSKGNAESRRRKRDIIAALTEAGLEEDQAEGFARQLQVALNKRRLRIGPIPAPRERNWKGNTQPRAWL